MDKRSVLREIGSKLRTFRETLKLKVSEMADGIGNERSGYIRYEQGKTPAKLMTLYKLAEKYDLSLDWLIRNKGPMYYKEKEIKEAKPMPTLDSLPNDIKELLDHMEKVPLLRYEVLAFFLKFKDKNKEMVANAFEKTEEV